MERLCVVVSSLLFLTLVACEADAPKEAPAPAESTEALALDTVGKANAVKGEEGSLGQSQAPRDTIAKAPDAPAKDKTGSRSPRVVQGTPQVLGAKSGGPRGNVVGAYGGEGINLGMGGLAGTSMGDAGGVGGLGTRGGGAGKGVGLGSLGTGAGGGGIGYGRGSGGLGARGTAAVGHGVARSAGILGALKGDTGEFSGRADATVNARTKTTEDALSTFAADVDTAAYAIARRTLQSGRLPTTSLVRVEETINYFAYDYDPPTDAPFSIQVDGAQSPVDSTKHYLRVGLQARVVPDAQRLPVNLVFLVDTSCSMTSGDKLALATKSLSVAVDQLTSKDRVAITTYAGGVRLVLPPTSGAKKSKIKAALSGLRTAGGTAMSSGLKLAYRQAAQMHRDGTTTRIIVCSDGDANIGATSHEAMLKQVRGYVDEGIRLSTIGFGDGNYRDATMEQLANDGNGNYFYVDSMRMAQRVFGRDFTKMVQDVAQDVKIQVEFDPATVKTYRLVGYENRAVADEDFRNDRVDAGEIGAGHQVTALYELELVDGDGTTNVATVRVRSKRPGGTKAKEVARAVELRRVARSFDAAPQDLKFAVAAMGAAELWRGSEWAGAWSYPRVASLLSDVATDADRKELLALVKKSQALAAHTHGVAVR
ncbi:MAG: von Willebrand factor type A domain-containing protein [Deltaproteobacteria bacterium]|jgi:Ca-activated chloride channel family protein